MRRREIVYVIAVCWCNCWCHSQTVAVGMNGAGVPDQGDGELIIVSLHPEGLKVAQKGTQRLPEPLLRVCSGCHTPVIVYPKIRCPLCGYIPANCVLSVREEERLSIVL